jgi:hypothetical protein
LDVAQLLTLKEKLKIINTLAKSEVESSPEQDLISLLGEVALKANELCQQPDNSCYSELEYFIFCLLIHLANKTTAQSNLATNLLINMVLRSQRFITEKANLLQDREDAAELELSLTKDVSFDNQLVFINYILENVLK